MEILKNKWIRTLLVLGMIFWIFSSNRETAKIVDYVKDTNNVKKDINYTVSKTREALILSKMSEEEIKEYYLNKQNEQKEAELAKIENNSIENNLISPEKQLSPKMEQNLSGLAKLQEAMQKNKLKEEVYQNNYKIDYQNNGIEPSSDNMIGSEPTEEEKMFLESYVAEKYGQLNEVTERVIQCGDYVSFEYRVYEGKKQITPQAMKMNLLIGSNILPEMEQTLTGMFNGQKKKFQISQAKQNKTNKSINLSQEIKILSIKEVEKRELLNCK